jgi:hypothetical protein
VYLSREISFNFTNINGTSNGMEFGEWWKWRKGRGMREDSVEGF